MKNEFVNYEIALALKELGFNEPCFSYYKNDQLSNILELVKNSEMENVNNEVDNYISAPTFSQAFRFFREKYQWQALIEATKDQHSHELGYNYFIWNSVTGLEYHTIPQNCPSGDWEFKTYEEAELACLLKIIEIVKNETK